jgi:hypothetical protein
MTGDLPGHIVQDEVVRPWPEQFWQLDFSPIRGLDKQFGLKRADNGSQERLEIPALQGDAEITTLSQRSRLNR